MILKDQWINQSIKLFRNKVIGIFLWARCLEQSYKNHHRTREKQQITRIPQQPRIKRKPLLGSFKSSFIKTRDNRKSQWFLSEKSVKLFADKWHKTFRLEMVKIQPTDSCTNIKWVQMLSFKTNKMRRSDLFLGKWRFVVFSLHPCTLPTLWRIYHPALLAYFVNPDPTLSDRRQRIQSKATYCIGLNEKSN